MSQWIPVALRSLVRLRARGHCEYCLLHETDTFLSHEVDHIWARKHLGPTHENNLAFACFACNTFKGTDIASVDYETGRIVRLFNPRTDKWSAHFRLEDGFIVPLTARGQLTERILQFNRLEFVIRRRLLMLAGRYPRR